MSNYTGHWFTSFGPMELSQDSNRVEGVYHYQGVQCSIEGRIEDGRLVFAYHEPTVSGEGWFEQRRPGRFAGQWQPQGDPRWFPWEGRRPFDGIWQSTFGPLRLIQDGDRVVGSYEGLGYSTIEGTLDGNRLTFRYQEPQVGGDGWFDLAPNGESFHGEWRPDGGVQWGAWDGRYQHAAPGLVWLVVLEAYWQRGFAEREYSFGAMLRAFFERLPQVEIRQRFFEDAAGLERWLRDVIYLPEPVALVLATHGDEQGLKVRGEPVAPERIIKSLEHADNVVLLHFSSCLMMKEGKASELARALQTSLSFPISGYNTSVDWAASALIEFHYLDMVLGRGLAPEEAARRLSEVVHYSGDEAPPACPYRAAGFRILMPTSAPAQRG
jgi:hypothetical protein